MKIAVGMSIPDREKRRSQRRLMNNVRGVWWAKLTITRSGSTDDDPDWLTVEDVESMRLLNRCTVPASWDNSRDKEDMGY